jgi:rhodanese-related sulfurtransferase
MAQHITKGVKALVTEANARIETLTLDQATALHGAADVVFIDLRDVRELWRDGKVAGAVHVPRGMLEFWIDPASPYHKPLFAEDKRFVLYCGSGWRSALAAGAAQDMGLAPVCHIDGGYTAWKNAGLPVEDVAPRPA